MFGYFICIDILLLWAENRYKHQLLLLWKNQYITTCSSRSEIVWKSSRVNKKVSASFCGTKLQYDFKKKLNLLWLFKHFMYKQKPRDNQDKEFTIVCFLCIKCVFHNLYYLKNCVIYSSQFHLKPFLYKVIKMIYKCI